MSRPLPPDECLAPVRESQPDGGLNFATLNQVPVAIAALDRLGVIVWTNEAWIQFGRDNELQEGYAAPGIDYPELCRAAGEDELADKLGALLTGRLPLYVHEYPCHSPGERRWFRLVAKTTCDPRAAAVLYHVNITPSTDFQARLQELQRFELVGRVMGSLAHDFNNLLTAILGHAASLQASRRHSRDEIGLIMRAAQHAGTLTRRMLTFARRRELSAETVSLGPWLLEVEPLLACIAGPNVTVSVSLPAIALHVTIDAVELEQVVLNLVLNARDAMPRGGPIAIRVEAASNRVGLHVEDRGEGISPEVLERIFEPFFTTKLERGTGLGLASVHDIVRRAGGTVEVRSEVGVGSAFSVWLPQGSAFRPSSTPSSAGSGRGAEIILFVEDDYRVRVPVARALRELGYEVLVSPSAEEALALPSTDLRRVQLLLTDVQMPGITGPELARRLWETMPALHVLYISGYAEADFSKGIAGPRFHYLPKPFAPEDLGRAIRGIFDGVGDPEPAN